MEKIDRSLSTSEHHRQDIRGLTAGPRTTHTFWMSLEPPEWACPLGDWCSFTVRNHPSWFILLKVPRGLPFQQSCRPVNMLPFYDTCILITPIFSFFLSFEGKLFFKKSVCFQKFFPSTIQQESLSPVPGGGMGEMVEFQVYVMVGYRSELTFRRKQSYIRLQ